MSPAPGVAATEWSHRWRFKNFSDRIGSDSPSTSETAGRVAKGKRRAVCRLFSHRFGWELRLDAPNGNVMRTQVCRSQEDVFATFESWKTSMLAVGWVEQVGVTDGN